MKKLLTSFGFLILAVLILFSFWQNSQGTDGELLDNKVINFNTGTNNIQLNLMKYKKNNDVIHTLRYKKNIFQHADLVLTGFEDDVMVCNQKEIRLSSDTNALCLIGDVGAHSQNVQLIRFNQDKLLPLDFITNGQSDPNIVSDLPEVKIMGYNEKNAEIIVKMRNYDTNPLTDSISNYYQGTVNGFVKVDK